MVLHIYATRVCIEPQAESECVSAAFETRHGDDDVERDIFLFNVT